MPIRDLEYREIDINYRPRPRPFPRPIPFPDPVPLPVGLPICKSFDGQEAEFVANGIKYNGRTGEPMQDYCNNVVYYPTINNQETNN